MFIAGTIYKLFGISKLWGFILRLKAASALALNVANLSYKKFSSPFIDQA